MLPTIMDNNEHYGTGVIIERATKNALIETRDRSNRVWWAVFFLFLALGFRWDFYWDTCVAHTYTLRVFSPQIADAKECILCTFLRRILLLVTLVDSMWTLSDEMPSRHRARETTTKQTQSCQFGTRAIRWIERNQHQAISNQFD